MSQLLAFIDFHVVSAWRILLVTKIPTSGFYRITTSNFVTIKMLLSFGPFLPPSWPNTLKIIIFLCYFFYLFGVFYLLFGFIEILLQIHYLDSFLLLCSLLFYIIFSSFLWLD